MLQAPQLKVSRHFKLYCHASYNNKKISATSSSTAIIFTITLRYYSNIFYVHAFIFRNRRGKSVFFQEKGRKRKHSIMFNTFDIINCMNQYWGRKIYFRAFSLPFPCCSASSYESKQENEDEFSWTRRETELRDVFWTKTNFHILSVKIFLHDCHKQVSFPFPEDSKDKFSYSKTFKSETVCAPFNAFISAFDFLQIFSSQNKYWEMLQKVWSLENLLQASSSIFWGWCQIKKALS